MKKKDIVQFFVWMRNGISFCVTWFLLLMVTACCISGREFIPTEALMKMIVLSSGGVFLFCTFFTRLFIRQKQFTIRLTGFILSIAVYECFGFYWIEFFSGKGSIVQWAAFTGIVIFLYLICIGIYHIYSRKKGELYTQALHRYQSERGKEDDI